MSQAPLRHKRSAPALRGARRAGFPALAPLSKLLGSTLWAPAVPAAGPLPGAVTAARPAADAAPGRPPGRPTVEPVAGPFGCALTVDVEEWYHTCLVPEYVQPAARPALPEELDGLLPELLDLLAGAGATATFFVLGEVAERLPHRIREIAAAGHEVASHGHHHLRASQRPLPELLADLRRAKDILEDLVGAPVEGYRAPEWSLRALSSPRVPLVAEAGYLYDSSLAPYLLAGRVTNPCHPVRLAWQNGAELLELPPLAVGPLRLPIGSWTGRLLPVPWLVDAVVACRARGSLPVHVVHPWELTGRPTPGRLTGLARFVHETGRQGYLPRFRELLAALPWTSLREAASLAPCGRTCPQAGRQAGSGRSLSDDRGHGAARPAHHPS
jgi:polysaccharide deacetylase family protein (PEP-CTERM system associated)